MGSRFFRPSPLKIKRNFSGLASPFEQGLSGFYKDDCCEHHDLPNLVSDELLADLLLKAALDIWKNKNLPVGSIDKEVTKAYATQLTKAIEEGYGKSLAEVDFDSTDYKLLESLQQQTWQFSAAKNYHQLRELGAALLDENGKLRSKQDFLREAQKINDIISKNHLKTEYNLAVQGGIHTAKWQDIQETKHLFPYLKWDAVLDDRTTEICTPLDGLILHVDDPRVDAIYPPNHYNCRTTVDKLSYGTAEPMEVPGTDIPPMFRVNLGKRGLAFPPDHPFFSGAPDDVALSSKKLMPYELQFNKLNRPGKEGFVREHFLVNRNEVDYNRVRQVSEEFADKGKTVDVLPIIDEKDLAHRNIIFKGGKSLKNPDLRINGILTEVEEVHGAHKLNTIGNAIRHGAKQADYVIVVLNEEVSLTDLNRIQKGRFKTHKNLQGIAFRLESGEYVTYTKPKGQP